MGQTLRTAKRTQAPLAWIINSDNSPPRLWLSGYAQDKDLVQHIKVLNGARKAAIAANNQFLSTAVRPCYSLGLFGADDG